MTPNESAAAVDSIDREIIELLLRDGRLSNRAVADAVSIAESTCHARLRNLIEQGVIKSFHACVDLAALGRPIQAVVFVRVRPQHRGQVVDEARRLVGADGVLDIIIVTGPYDLLVRVAVASPAALQNFVFQELDASPAIVATETHVMTDNYLGSMMSPAAPRSRRLPS
ncbi:MAG: Lrp/AsnC family transcriptional regulator [Propionibacteriaceae bacterium]|jgi:DNA-binding Lrp family transcriptional regulator|nr:Lrp/AsnC family transcriptional regulator [Propionibacteriaceae bacterium]